MNRRAFLKTAVASSVAVGFTGTSLAAEIFYPVKIDKSLFSGINRVKDPAKKTALELSHAPVISVPSKVKAGELFELEVSVGEKLHPMGPSHWIGFIAVSIGNEPAGRFDLQPKGYLMPVVSFRLVIPKELAPDGKATIVVRQECNLHGLWEASATVTVI